MNYYGQQQDQMQSMAWQHNGVHLPPRPSEIDQYEAWGADMMPAQPGDDSDEYTKMFASETLPMQATTKHPKVKLKIILSSAAFEAGTAISGALELTTMASQRLRLGEIAVELEACEELTSRDHAATQIFLFNRTLFQGEHLPPSNAVLPAAPLKGHWTARKGRTTFPFSFRLPASCPSSIDFSGHARLRYALKGTVQVWWNDSKSLVTVRSDAPVVEQWHDELDPRYLEPIEALADTHLFMGGSGTVWLEAALNEQLFVAGETCNIRAGIKNGTKRNLSGLKVAIARRLTLAIPEASQHPAQQVNLEPQITEIVHTQNFKGPSFEFPQQQEVTVDLPVNLPRELRTVRKTRLFEVHLVALVSLDMGSFAKDLIVELPFFAAHPLSFQEDAPKLERPVLPRRAQSSMGQHGQHQAAPEGYERITPSPLPNPFHRPQTAVPDTPFEHMPVQQWPPQDCVPPLRPASASGAIAIPFVSPEALSVSPHTGQQMWKPAAVDWNNPTSLGNMPPRHLPRAMSSQGLARSPTSVRGALPPTPVQRAQSIQPQPNQGPVLQPSLRREPTAGSTHLLAVKPSRSMSAPDALRDEELPRNGSYLQASPMAHSLSSAAQAPQPELQLQALQQGKLDQSPMPSMLGQDDVPASFQDNVFIEQPNTGLQTITEDSESNAGTVRGTHKLQSISRNDIDQFEKMAQQAEDEEEARKAMLEVGMVPDEDSLSREQAHLSTKQVAIDKALPKTPFSLRNEPIASSSLAKAAVKDFFNASPRIEEKVQDGKETTKDAFNEKSDIKASREDAEIIVKEASGQKRQSLQGFGLASLETSLQEESSLPKASRKTIPLHPSESVASKKPEKRDNNSIAADQPPAMTSPSSTSSGSQRRLSRQMIANSVLRAAASAAATRERRAREDEEERRRDEEERKAAELRKAQRDRSASGAGHSDKASLGIERSNDHENRSRKNSDGQSSRSRGGERKQIDENEARQLKKQALNRVNGWLSSSPNTSTTDLLAVKDTVTSPKTPHASYLETKTGPGKRDSIDATLKRPAKYELSTVDSFSTAQQSAKSYETKSIRGGPPGRVANIANMWASIADGTDGSKLKSSEPVVTLRPQARRSGFTDVRLLEFSSPTTPKGTDKVPDLDTNAPESDQNEKKRPQELELAAEKKPLPKSKQPLSPPFEIKSRVRSPSNKSNSSAQLANTTMPRPVFSARDIVPKSKPTNKEAAAAVSPKPLGNASSDKLNASRKMTSDVVAAEARQNAGVHAKDIKEACQKATPTSKEGRPSQLPMGGRGTTKPIGKDKLANLRSLWGG